MKARFLVMKVRAIAPDQAEPHGDAERDSEAPS